MKLWRKAWNERRENIRLPAPFTVCKSTPAFRMMFLKVSESPRRPLVRWTGELRQDEDFRLVCPRQLVQSRQQVRVKRGGHFRAGLGLRVSQGFVGQVHAFPLHPAAIGKPRPGEIGEHD